MDLRHPHGTPTKPAPSRSYRQDSDNLSLAIGPNGAFSQKNGGGAQKILVHFGQQPCPFSVGQTTIPRSCHHKTHTRRPTDLHGRSKHGGFHKSLSIDSDQLSALAERDHRRSRAKGHLGEGIRYERRRVNDFRFR